MAYSYFLNFLKEFPLLVHAVKYFGFNFMKNSKEDYLTS